jgi:hypothetical protein
LENNNISIGENKWIVFEEWERGEESLEIDHLFEPSKLFWDNLETDCMVECCGVNAYNLWKKDIQSVYKKIDDPGILPKLQELRLAILEQRARVVTVHFMNNLFTRNCFLELLDHIILSIENETN